MTAWLVLEVFPKGVLSSTGSGFTGNMRLLSAGAPGWSAQTLLGEAASRAESCPPKTATLQLRGSQGLEKEQALALRHGCPRFLPPPRWPPTSLLLAFH